MFLTVPKKETHNGKAQVKRQAEINCGGGVYSSDRMRKSSHRSNSAASAPPGAMGSPGLAPPGAMAPPGLAPPGDHIQAASPNIKASSPFDVNRKAPNRNNVKLQQSDLCTSGGK